MPFLTLAPSTTREAPALLDKQGSWSFGQLAEEADQVARRLAKLGRSGGRPVALFGATNRHQVGALHGIWRAGFAAAPFNTRWTGVEEAQALALLEPSVILVGEDHPGPDPAVIPAGAKIFRLGTSSRSPWPLLADLEPEVTLPARPDSDADAVRLLTSGTTGRPRMVRITVGNLVASAQASETRLSLRPSDRWLGSLSPAHVGGVALITRAAIVGSSIVLQGSFDAVALEALAAEGAITHASLVPTMLHRYLEAAGGLPVPETLRCLLIGGAPVPTALVDTALDSGIPLGLTYGLTEASSQVATAEPGLVRRKPGTVGRPLPGVEVGLGDGGEILVRGATVAPGQVEADGWLHTGDLGSVDDEGHLWVTGRASDRIISGGLSVDPSEIAAVLESHPIVEEAVVVGVPDEEWGETIAAAVVLFQDVAPSRVSELDALAGSVLSSGKRPRAFRVVSSFPRNANGKVDREAIRSLFL
jgi:O-succinylbenzoic acid--CoA ligase